MKPKIISTLLILPCLLSTFGCKKNTQHTPPEQNPFQEGEVSYYSNSDYDPNATHGEKNLYGNKLRSGFLKFNDMIITRTPLALIYYDFNTPTEEHYLCFDPACQHDVLSLTEECQATLNAETLFAPPGDLDFRPIEYPIDMLLDFYDTVEAPVLYLSFRRQDFYVVNGETQYRDEDYCIERYDISRGSRTVVADGIKETILDLLTYGDYLYFVQNDADNNQSICTIPKTGGNVERISEEKATYKILEVVDEKIYYLCNERYLMQCDPNLTNSKQILDISTLKGETGEKSNGIVAGIYGRYLYYYADIEIVYSSMPDGQVVETGEKCNCYRVPLDNVNAPPQKIAEDMAYNVSQYIAFTEDTLYYEPAVYEWVDQTGFDTGTSYNPVNHTNGTLYALDLNTLERTTVCEDIGMLIYIQYAIDDMIIFDGYPYEPKGAELANDARNKIIGRKNGAPLEIWYDSSKPTTLS